jgi:hypothetical protein
MDREAVATLTMLGGMALAFGGGILWEHAAKHRNRGLRRRGAALAWIGLGLAGAAGGAEYYIKKVSDRDAIEASKREEKVELVLKERKDALSAFIRSNARFAALSSWRKRPTLRNAFEKTRTFRYLKYREEPDPQAGSIYINRKVIIADTQTLTVHAINDLLRTDLQAWAPDEAGTIVFYEAHDDQIGEYSGGGKAFSREVLLTFVDVDKGRLIGRVQFCDPQKPPEFVLSGSNGRMGPEFADLSRYVEELPVK